MDGNALEVALALLRLPSMRGSLRMQPLPDDVEQLIVLAAGAAAPLAAASARSGELPAQVLEAARFYIREIMLFHGADAYRVLGVSPSASEARIKLNYRHLQHWLHPDRVGNDWESVFATRINTAWHALRTPARRAAYDAKTSPEASTPHRVLVSEWRPAPAAGTGHGWWWFALAVAGCLGLVWLALQQANAPAPQWEPSARSSVTAAPVPLLTDEEMQVLQRLLAQQAITDPDRDHAEALPVVAAPAKVTAFQTVQAQPAVAQPAPLTTISIQPVAEAGSSWVLDRPAEPIAVAKTLAPPAPANVKQVMPAQAARIAPLPTNSTRPAEAAAVQPLPANHVSLEQIQLAQHRGRELTHYLISPAHRPPPIWRNASAQDAAASLRDRFDGEHVQFVTPDWRIAGERASMTSALKHSGKAGLPTTLRAELAWHDGMWLVDRVETDGLP